MDKITKIFQGNSRKIRRKLNSLGNQLINQTNKHKLITNNTNKQTNEQRTK
jgi:hypothetical protein